MSSQHLRWTGVAVRLCFTLACASGVAAQNTRPLAIKNARILTLVGDPIERGTVLIKDGRITEIGESVKVPPGSEVVDANGGTLMPGFVSAWSHAGVDASSNASPSLPRQFRRASRRASSGARNKAVSKAGEKLADSLYARQPVFHELLEVGVTTLAIAPTGIGMPGLAARVNPNVETEDGFVTDDDAYVAMRIAANTNTKAAFGKALDAGKKALEERNQPKPAEKPADDAKSKGAEPAADKGQAESKPADDPKPKPEDEPKPKPTPKPADDPKPKDGDKPAADAAEPTEDKAKAKEPKKDPNSEVLADLLERKRHAFVVVNSANELQHFLGAIDKHRFPLTIVTQSHNSSTGSIDTAIDDIVKLEASVLTRPELTTPAYRDTLFDPCAALREKGVAVAYLIGDSKSEVRGLLFRLIELVRHGATRGDVLRSVTAVPAKLLGLEREVGTIENKKWADILLFDGDPLDPASKLVDVYYRGVRVGKDAN